MTLEPYPYVDLPDPDSFMTAAKMRAADLIIGSYIDNKVAGLVNVRAYGALGDDTNQEIQIQEAIDDNPGATIIIPEGNYKFNRLTLKSRTHIVCMPGAILKPQNNQHAVIGDSPTARTPATTHQLTVNTVVGATTVTVSAADSANYAAGDRVTLRDATFAINGENCRRETNVVKSVNTGTGVITLERPIGHIYQAANDSWIAKVTTTKNAGWFGGEFDMAGVAGGIASDCDAIYMDWAENCVFEGITTYNHPDKSVDLHGALDCVIRDCNAYSPSRVGEGEGYNVRVHYSRDCKLEGGWSRNVRHHFDISGGQGCKWFGGSTSGRTTSNQCGAFLHGLESRWCGGQGFYANNVETAMGAGNGSFGGDFDFEIEGHAVDCDIGWFLVDEETTGKVRGRADRSVIRGLAIDNVASVDIDVLVDGIQTNPSNFGAINIAGTANVSGRAKIRNAIYRSLQSTSSGEVNLDVDIDHPSSATSIPVVSSTMVASTRFTIGGRIKANNVALTAIAATGGAGTIVFKDGIQILGTYSARSSIAGGTLILGTTRRTYFGTAAPTVGPNEVGDVNWRTNAAAGGPPGDVCVAAGTPGTWKAMANLAA